MNSAPSRCSGSGPVGASRSPGGSRRLRRTDWKHKHSSNMDAATSDTNTTTPRKVIHLTVCRLCGAELKFGQKKQVFNLLLPPLLKTTLEALVELPVVGEDTPQSVCARCFQLLNKYLLTKENIEKVVNQNPHRLSCFQKHVRQNFFWIRYVRHCSAVMLLLPGGRQSKRDHRKWRWILEIQGKFRLCVQNADLPPESNSFWLWVPRMLNKW